VRALWRPVVRPVRWGARGAAGGRCRGTS